MFNILTPRIPFLLTPSLSDNPNAELNIGFSLTCGLNVCIVLKVFYIGLCFFKKLYAVDTPFDTALYISLNPDPFLLLFTFLFAGMFYKLKK